MSLSLNDCIAPLWPAPANVRSLITTRNGGVSLGPLSSLNLGRSVGDEPSAVAENRRRVEALVGAAPRWMSQVHGIDVAPLDKLDANTPITADAAFSRSRQNVCTVMMADCLTVLFCDRQGSVVATAHAGWRGLAQGVLEAAIAAMKTPAQDILAYMGPAIGSRMFEVGHEVRALFLSAALPVEHSAVGDAFVASVAPESGKWLADIYALARTRMVRSGLRAENIYGGGHCTYVESSRFFSYRRSTHRGEKSGRMAAMIWLD